MAYALRGLKEDGSVALSFLQEVTGHRSQYASGAIGQMGHVAEVVEGALELLCIDPIEGVTAEQ